MSIRFLDVSDGKMTESCNQDLPRSWRKYLWLQTAGGGDALPERLMKITVGGGGQAR